MIDPVLTLFLGLLVAHLLADFAMQSDEDVARKTEPAFFLKHIGTVTVLSWLLAGDWTNWIIPLVVFVSHALLDSGKLLAQRHGWNETRLFAWDQVGHVVAIFGLTVFLGVRGEPSNAVHSLFGDIYPVLLLIAAGFLVTVHVAIFVIMMAFAGFRTRMSEGGRAGEGAVERNDGLRQGGRVIGQLERVLIFVFVMIGSPEAVAFLLVAKALFCLVEVRGQAREVRDYVLIGTLMSFSWGLLFAWLTRFLLERL